MNDRKSKFLSAVQILAPHDQFIYQAAQRIPAEQLPAYPGATALEFVVAVQKLRQPLQDLQIQATKNKQRPGSSRSAPHKKLSLSHALRIKGAEYWLKLGEADEALRELERLPGLTWKHPTALKARIAAIGMQENNQTAISA
jgi:hypothetical protein